MAENEIGETGEQRPAYSGIRILLKAVVFTLPATLLPYVRPVHSHTLFGLTLILGVLLQALIPPRRKGFVSLILCTVVFTIIYSFI